MCMQRWNICIPHFMEELPSLYWIPKSHKKLCLDSRFIAACNKCTTKSLSSLLQSVSKKVLLLHLK